MLESQPQSVIEEVLLFSSSVGLPLTLAHIGIRDPEPDILEQIARRSTAAGETIHNEPFPISSKTVVEALRAADSAGGKFQQSRMTYRASD